MPAARPFVLPRGKQKKNVRGVGRGRQLLFAWKTVDVRQMLWAAVLGPVFRSAAALSVRPGVAKYTVARASMSSRGRACAPAAYPRLAGVGGDRSPAAHPRFTSFPLYLARRFT